LFQIREEAATAAAEVKPREMNSAFRRASASVVAVGAAGALNESRVVHKAALASISIFYPDVRPASPSNPGKADTIIPDFLSESITPQ